MPKSTALRVALVFAVTTLLFASVSVVAQEKGDDSGLNFGLTANNKASLHDVGLPLVMLKYQSDDSPDKVAAFYRKELAKYGKVLDCSDPANNKTESSGLTCKDDKPDPGSVILKAGTKQHQHLVGIKPDGSRSVFQLIYLESKDSKNHFD